MNDENPFEGLERLYKEEHMDELRDSLRSMYEAKGMNVNEEKLEKVLKLFTRIYVDVISDDIVFIDSETSLIFN